MFTSQHFLEAFDPSLRKREPTFPNAGVGGLEDSASLENDPSNDSAGTVILVVDDDEILRTVICKALQKAGYATIARPTAKEAIRFLSSRRCGHTILLTDLVLEGGEGGWFLAQQVRQMFPAVSIVFMSGYIDEAAVQAMMAHGNVSYLPKPFELTALVQAVGASVSSTNR